MNFNFTLKDPKAGDEKLTLHSPKEAVGFLAELMRDFSNLDVTAEISITIEMETPKIEPPCIITLN